MPSILPFPLESISDCHPWVLHWQRFATLHSSFFPPSLFLIHFSLHHFWEHFPFGFAVYLCFLVPRSFGVLAPAICRRSPFSVFRASAAPPLSCVTVEPVIMCAGKGKPQAKDDQEYHSWYPPTQHQNDLYEIMLIWTIRPFTATQ